MILIYGSDLDWVKMNHHVKYLDQRALCSTVICEHTNTAGRLQYLDEKVVSKYKARAVNRDNDESSLSHR